MPPTQTALIVPVPEAEQAVGPHRAVLDPSAAWGVPAHVTILYPFLPPNLITEEVRSTLRATVARTPRFEAVFRRIGWFEETVVWLAPEPAQPFRDLTAAIWHDFRETPPYGGAHDGVVPHLTIGHDAPPEVLRRAARAVAGRLPLHAAVHAVSLVAGSSETDSWHTTDVFPLGG